jgi:excisionase family DNA binding protein
MQRRPGRGEGDGAPPETLRWADAPDVLTPREVGALLRLSRTSVYESLRSGLLEDASFKWGRKYLISKAALRRLIEGGERDV